MLLEVRHRTVYNYAELVSTCHNQAHLLPRNQPPRQQVRERSITVTPSPAVINHRLDFYGNTVTFFTVQQAHHDLEVVAESVIEVTAAKAHTPRESYPWETTGAFMRSDLSPRGLEACEFAFPSPLVPVHRDLLSFAKKCFPPGRPMLEAVLDLNHRIFTEFKYLPQSTTVSTPVLEVLSTRRGVCQDFAHLMIGCLRSLGLSARYVSGYLMTVPPPGQKRLQGADASHAWVSVYFPDLGWLDFDPTNDVMVSDKHVTLAWGRDYNDVSPLRGVVLGGGAHTVGVAVDVVPRGESAP